MIYESFSRTISREDDVIVGAAGDGGDGGALDGENRGGGEGSGGGGGLDAEDTRGVDNGVEQSADVAGAPGNAGAPKDQVV